MNIAVLGLGYVGSLTAACLSREGHSVVGVDVNARKVEMLNDGRSPVLEPGLDELIGQAVETNKLHATTDVRLAVEQSSVSIICVGTPSKGNGSLQLSYVDGVCRDIGAALASSQDYHVVVVRSTVLPGTVEERLIPVLQEHSGRRAGYEFGVCMNPEFLREGTGLQDYYNPSYVIVGELDVPSGDVVEHLYDSIAAPIIRTTLRTAEMVKYASNAFHALKVTFANEIGSVCKAHNIDGRDVMNIFCRDERLNLSAAYFRPGFAFGGSCLPKDVRALLYRARERDIDVPLLRATLESNEAQVRRGVKLVEDTGRKRIGILGLSFKAGTDDVRESPVVSLVETLFGRGYQVCVYDDHVAPDKLIGANRLFLERELPHIASLMASSVEEVVRHSEVVVVANSSPAFGRVTSLLREDQVLIDLIGALRPNGELRGVYEGIGW
ncbi:MAG: UDP-glucose/GDP-mannose dehydrogenase family protein [Chloroflexi bacterium]|nr:UDP-glucose/GDP-mannose dehydrogenase family protein [Chloroflexota bacterium]